MEYQYAIEDLASLSGITTQSAYAFIRKNKAFVDEHSTRIHRKVKYSKAVLKLFLDYYKPDHGDETQTAPIDAPADERIAVPNNTVSLQEFNDQKQRYEEELAKVRAERDALREQLDRAYQDLDARKQEVSDLIRQNGLVLLTLSQEKQEKQLLLEAPRWPWQGLFSGKKKKKAERVVVVDGDHQETK